jgi:tRNA U54 and U55 pseudouridine synthase Pus10
LLLVSFHHHHSSRHPIHVACEYIGNYLKYDRDLSQSPWLIGGKKQTASSVEEEITRCILPHFHATGTCFC